MLRCYGRPGETAMGHHGWIGRIKALFAPPPQPCAPQHPRWRRGLRSQRAAAARRTFSFRCPIPTIRMACGAWAKCRWYRPWPRSRMPFIVPLGCGSISCPCRQAVSWKPCGPKSTRSVTAERDARRVVAYVPSAASCGRWCSPRRRGAHDRIPHRHHGARSSYTINASIGYQIVNLPALLGGALAAAHLGYQG
jgi:hypothetical protein